MGDRMMEQIANTSDENTDIKPIEQPDEPEYEFLDCARLTVFCDDSRRIRATVADDKSFLDVRFVRCFPNTNPDAFWALLDRKSQVIGIIADPAELDDDSRSAGLASLEEQYFCPVVTAIRSMKEEFGAVYFDVETDRGPRSFVSKGVRESIEEQDTGNIVLTDVDENRYVIPDWTRLDAKSRKLIAHVV